MKCIICQSPLSGKQKKFCSDQCKDKDPDQHGYLRQKKRGMVRKRELVDSLGGACVVCGYSKNLAALCFHHNDPALKSFGLNMRAFGARSMERLLAEAVKCTLLCSNCHMEAHWPDYSLRD